MITAIVRFKLPPTVDAARAAELFEGSVPKYRGLPGLIRKYYLFDAESRTGGDARRPTCGCCAGRCHHCEANARNDCGHNRFEAHLDPFLVRSWT